MRTMKVRKGFYGFLAAVLAAAVFASAADRAWAASAQGIISDSIDVLRDMAKQEDADAMADVLKDARAVAIVPAMVKAGLIIGGEYGEGVILRREKGRWYGPSYYNLGGGSLGLQIGAQKISLVLVVTNEDGVRAFLNSRTKLGADVSVAAGPTGRRAEAATDAQARASIYSYSMTKGLFAGVSLEGSVISVSVKRNEDYWKKKLSADDALKQPAKDKRILPLTGALDNLARKAR